LYLGSINASTVQSALSFCMVACRILWWVLISLQQVKLYQVSGSSKNISIRLKNLMRYRKFCVHLLKTLCNDNIAQANVLSWLFQGI